MSTLRSRDFYRRVREFQEYAAILSLSLPVQIIDETAVVDDEENPSSAYLELLSEMVRKMSRRERQKHFHATLDLFNFYATKFGSEVPKNVLRRTFKSLLFTAADFLGPAQLGEFFSECSRTALNRFGFAYKYEKSYFRSCVYRLQDVNSRVDGKRLKDEISRDILKFGSVRMQMLAETLAALFNASRATDQAYLSLLWKAVPDPFISTTEMSALLKPFFKEERLKLREFCDEYRKRNTIFEVPEVSQPRRLKHLSRFAVRKSLSYYSSSIGDDVTDCLCIPHVLKGYLKLDSF